MKTFIFSYIASVLSIIFVSYPAVQAAPLDLIPRIFIYLGFPSAVVLSIAIMALSHVLGLSGLRTPINSEITNASKGLALNPEAHAA
ncbi:MAG: hypothetical protein HOE30_22875 [Deltaproteobacteria bacterium]|jgi:hypothetical protein|nr:hypothetical protein [Deltaproteobacteria bacterium]MBT4091340.1 hypothetical protein [Deltaproteobacteria bacterium]MBT4268804.1 hypothetical protein [Deltaproteobacteria bacterium]MBT4638324.1 hypothetical protein [Deltaproteobacteria bacterium]MBT6499662.1 hypothetical protein [Deltaproteobacteria bacterium]